ncbi:MAG: sodium:phosphate symporter [Rhodopirellula sp.]|nr:sodium:phosphate symporter [Rhodopirellula sp.]OUX50972.1 MAG: sodium:phosphate symporter [Rhodopirellula sp. TMED283]
MELDVLVKLSFGLMGGLGIFLLGMKNMSDGMQAVAGASLRSLIGIVTNNRFLATIVGIVVTCVVQSSSVTTVMVIGFVNSGVMGLSQAIGVIMGANIGTTITSWILVLKIGKYGLPLLGIAALFFLFSKSERWRYWAMAIMGVGMVFFGLELMKDACAIIKETPQFEKSFQYFTADTYLGVLKCALLGCLLTTLVQSSSATLVITISLAYAGVIGYETAAALVLGENIGTTITALLASLGATTNAKRAAYFHMIFNLIGVLWITSIFWWYIGFIQQFMDFCQWILPNLFGDKPHSISEMVKTDGGNETYPYTTAAIALTHSIFNVVNTLLFLPFLPFFVRLLERMVPSKDFKEKPSLTDLDMRLLETPLFAIEQSRKEIEKMSIGCEKMLVWIDELYDQDEIDKNLADKLMHREQVLDSVQDEIAQHVTNLLSNDIPHSVAVEARQQFRMADEYESISDYIVNIHKFDVRLRRDDQRFTTTQRSGIKALNKVSMEYLDLVNQALTANDPGAVTKTESVSKRLRKQIKQLRRGHLSDLTEGSIPPQVSVAYLAVLNAFSRVRDHIENVAGAVSGEK